MQGLLDSRPLTLLLALLRLATGDIRRGLGSQDEVRLVHDLFEEKGYNPLIRPVADLSQNVSVQFGLAMIQLINVDEKNQVMKSNVWLRMVWTDYQLSWDPASYGGINKIRILPDRVWKPDIVLFNNADGKYEVSYKPNVVITSNGEVLWIPPAIYKSSCTIDVEFFPFDEQKCQMKFGSWTFNGEQVDLAWYQNKERVDLSDYVNSGTWDIIECDGEYSNTKANTTRKIRVEGEEVLNTAQITFTIVIRRKTLFYTVNLIIPCVLISFLSICVFYLPADAGEKVTMCISILLALVVFLLLVSKILPPTSMTVPLISKYLLFTFIMNIFTIIITVIIINWNFRTPRTHRMPPWVRTLFLNYLPRALLMKRPNHHDNADRKPHSRTTTTPTVHANARSDHGNFVEMADVHHPSCRHHPERERSPEVELMQMSPETSKAVDSVRFIAAHLKNEDEYAEILEDWRYIAMVMDRLMLYIFLAVTVGGTVGILVSADHIFEYVDQDKIKEAIIGKKD